MNNSVSNSFLLKELIKRDFILKYKGTKLGVVWSILSPMFLMLVMRMVFIYFFSRTITHYTTYIFCGTIIYSYFANSTKDGMQSLYDDSKILININLKKDLFILSKTIVSFINFLITIIVFIIFCLIDNIKIDFRFFILIYPIITLFVFILGVNYFLATLRIMFKDLEYLWTIILRIIMYLSAIFYNIDNYSPFVRGVFHLNPIYVFIAYWRNVVINAEVPSLTLHILCLVYSILSMSIGYLVYKKKEKELYCYL